MCNKNKLIADLRSLGVSVSDTVIVHTSLKGLNTEGLTAQEVIEALMELVGHSGTILFPALSYSTVTADNPVFDVDRTSTCVGVTPEVFRMEYAECRSVHPTHSVCAVGKLAQQITQNHYLDRTPIGVNSPFRLISESDINGKILMLGCGLRPNTFMHGVEEVAEASYVLSKSATEYTFIASGSQYKKQYLTHSFGGLIQRYERLEQVIQSDNMKKGTVLNGTAYLISAPKAMEIGISMIKKNDKFFVD